MIDVEETTEVQEQTTDEAVTEEQPAEQPAEQEERQSRAQERIKELLEGIAPTTCCRTKKNLPSGSFYNHPPLTVGCLKCLTNIVL